MNNYFSVLIVMVDGHMMNLPLYTVVFYYNDHTFIYVYVYASLLFLVILFHTTTLLVQGRLITLVENKVNAFISLYLLFDFNGDRQQCLSTA